MTEYENFMETLENKSDATKKQYRLQYNKLLKLTGKNIADTSEKKIIELLDNIDNKNNSQALLNIALLIRRMNKLSTTQLEAKREADKKKINTAIREGNKELKENLPTYNDLVEYTEHLYNQGEWTDFIINWLLLNIQVRNQDLDFTIIKAKKEATDKTKNYMWLSPTKLVYIRNVYKTSTINKPDGSTTGYGQKLNTITDKKMISAIRKVLTCKELKEPCGTFIPNKSSIAYYLQKATYKGIGEGKYFKVVVNHYRNDLDKLKEISDNRGTDLKTIMNFYDINV